MSANDEPPFDGIAEVWFDDLDAMRANVGTEALGAIRADEANFIDPATMGTLLTAEHVIVDGTPGEGCRKLMGLIARNADYAPEDFQATYKDQLGPIVEQVPGVDRYVQAHCRLGIYARRQPPFDAVASLWFGDAPLAMRSAEMARANKLENQFMDFSRIELAWVEPLTII